MSCREASALVEKQRDRKLGYSERLGLWLHLGYCSVCAMFFEQSKLLDRSARSYAEKVNTEQKAFPLKPEQKAGLQASFDAELEKLNKE